MQTKKVVLPILSALAILCAAYGGSDGKPDAQVDSFLEVDVTNPGDGETGIPLNHTLGISFAQELDPSTIGSGDITVVANEARQAVGSR
ncbi:MAG: Ig-like domain-containing protein [Myxococcales bacterium]|nr:Ig-like domain-containing protein [Myxococcales bacterium]